MSSYIESAYSIEHRRLQQIVTKCQQELNEATSRLCKRRHEIENASDVFQEHMLRGQMEQKKSEEERVEHARAEAEKIRVQLNGQGKLVYLFVALKQLLFMRPVPVTLRMDEERIYPFQN